jgi:hypothetical protein
MWSVDSQLTFWRSISCPSSAGFLLHGGLFLDLLFGTGNGGHLFPRNVRWPATECAALPPGDRSLRNRRWETSRPVPLRAWLQLETPRYLETGLSIPVAGRHHVLSPSGLGSNWRHLATSQETGLSVTAGVRHHVPSPSGPVTATACLCVPASATGGSTERTVERRLTARLSTPTATGDYIYLSCSFVKPVISFALC